MSQNEVKIALNKAEASLNMEGIFVSKQAKALCEKLLNKEITMAEYLSFVKQKAGINA